MLCAKEIRKKSEDAEEGSNVDQQPDRRGSPRYAVDAEATVVMVNHGSHLRGRLVELSVDGCRLRADRYCALAAPATIEVLFKLNGIDFRLGGTMQWAEARQTAGIQFGPMAQRRREFLVELLAELEAEKAAAGEAPTADVGQMDQDADPEAGDRHSDGSAMALVPTPVSAPAEPGFPKLPAAAAGYRDRRTQARHAVDSRATIYFVDVRARMGGCIIDVSLGGCRIHTDERFPVGIYRRVETEFTFDGVPFRLAGVVQSLHDKFTVGIRFLDMSERKRRQLTELIEEIEEMQGTGNRD